MSSTLPIQPAPPSALAELFGWWRAELADTLARPFKHKVIGPSEIIPDIIMARDGLLLGPTKRGPFAPEELALRATEAFGAKGLPRSIAIALDKSRFIRRKLADHRIPLVRAQKMAELDVETQTPFRLHDVYILFADTSSERSFHYYLVRRDVLDPLLIAMRRSRRRLAALIFDEGTGSSHASAFVVASLNGRRSTTLMNVKQHGFVFTVIALLALAGYNINASLAKAESTVDEKIETLEPKAKAARLTFKKRNEDLNRIQAIRADQRSYFPVVRILEDLSFTLPDSTYLTSFSVRQNKIKITGFSSDAAALIPLVDSSKILANPRFVSAVVRAPDGKMEQFDLEVEVQHAR